MECEWLKPQCKPTNRETDDTGAVVVYLEQINGLKLNETYVDMAVMIRHNNVSNSVDASSKDGKYVCDLTLSGNLFLGQNQLRTLPESFGSLKVGGDLDLGQNQLRTLPESFGSLTVGRSLFLDRNQLRTLPESFPNVKGKVSK